MKRIGIILFLTGLLFGRPAGFTQDTVFRYAEDLWGEKIPIDSLVRNSTLTIVPFSTSNCGYCLIDGYFSEENYNSGH